MLFADALLIPEAQQVIMVLSLLHFERFFEAGLQEY
jgi:hypothetical protein